MQRITRDKLPPVFDRRSPPVAHVAPGEAFIVETEDSRGGRTRAPEHTTPEYLLAMRKQSKWREIIGWIEELNRYEKHEAYLLAGCVGAWRPGQVQISNYSMRCIFPKQYLRERR